MQRKQRLSKSTAYIDSGAVGAYFIGVLAFATFVAVATADVISPWWLSGSIIAVATYQLLIFWLILQAWEINKIFGIFTLNILSLSIVFFLVETVFSVQLPIDLPVLNVIVSAYGLSAESMSPGSVALSYSVLALLVGTIVSGLYSVIDNIKPTMKLKRLLGLDKVDEFIDHTLERFSAFIDVKPFAWVGTPLVLLAVLLVIVVGGASLL